MLVAAVGRLAAEPHLLAEWSRTTHHPRLQDAYRALIERVEPRARAVAEAAATVATRDALSDATVSAHDDGATRTTELSRLKWLLAGRRERLAQEGLPGYAEHTADETEEAAELEALLAALLAHLC